MYILVLNSTLLQPMYLYITQYCLDYCGLYQVIQFTWFVIIQYNFKYCIFSTFSYKFQNKIFLFSHKKFVENVLLEIEKGKSLSCLLCNPRHCSLPGSTVHGILQARILEWVAILFSRDPPNPGIEPRSPTLQGDSLPSEPSGKPKNIGVGSLSLLQQIFPTQELNQGLLHCRQILYLLSYQGSPC